MPFKESKSVPGLITHYGRWTKQDENDFYNRVNFSDWRGSSGLIPQATSPRKIDSSQNDKGDKDLND